jgi:hypothetical protein
MRGHANAPLSDRSNLPNFFAIFLEIFGSLESEFGHSWKHMILQVRNHLADVP